jgi:hypothetical protein
VTAAGAPQVPSAEEIEALLAGRKQTTIVFFLDETFEELEFDATATVLEAVEFLARVIKLEHFTTFTLYECRKARRRGRAHFVAAERRLAGSPLADSRARALCDMRMAYREPHLPWQRHALL